MNEGNCSNWSQMELRRWGEWIWCRRNEWNDFRRWLVDCVESLVAGHLSPHCNCECQYDWHQSTLDASERTTPFDCLASNEWTNIYLRLASTILPFVQSMTLQTTGLSAIPYIVLTIYGGDIRRGFDVRKRFRSHFEIHQRFGSFNRRCWVICMRFVIQFRMDNLGWHTRIPPRCPPSKWRWFDWPNSIFNSHVQLDHNYHRRSRCSYCKLSTT